MANEHSANEAYLSEVCAFLNKQDYIAAVSLDALRAGGSIGELGITSLGAIALTASYVRDRGLADADFNPEWVPRLADVPGVLSVFAEIDALAGRPGALAAPTAA